MRGEHVTTTFHPPPSGGSSPHARGTLLNPQLLLSHVGIIPACAGNTSCVRIGRANLRDHPRMRGEHRAGSHEKELREGSSPHARGTLGGVRGAGQISVGSSPHARGTPRKKRLQRPYGGIIPACAGNTGRCHNLLVAQRDHPRMRGEHSLMLSPPRWLAGSSPHARGTLTCSTLKRST